MKLGEKVNDVVVIEEHEFVQTWTLNLPEKRNPISSDEVVEALVRAVAKATVSDVRAVIITGSGSAFSTGGNVDDMASRQGLFGGTVLDQRNAYRAGVQRIPKAIYESEIPFIAAVNGPAIGVGFDLALMCDIRIASERALFAESYVQLGIVPGGGGAWLLPRLVGASRAAELIMTGDRIDAATAYDWGLVSQVVPDEKLLPAARGLAARIARNSPHAVRLAKRLVREGQSQTLRSHLELAASVQPLLQDSAEHHAAIREIKQRGRRR